MDAEKKGGGKGGLKAQGWREISGKEESKLSASLFQKKKSRGEAHAEQIIILLVKHVSS